MTPDKISILIFMISLIIYMIYNEYIKTKYKNRVIELLTVIAITRESIKQLVSDEELKKKLLIRTFYYENKDK